MKGTISDTLFAGKESLFVLGFWHGGRRGRCGRDRCNCMIFTSGYVVTVVIMGAGLLGLHAGNLVIVHNYQHWEALHTMNVDEKEKA